MKFQDMPYERIDFEKVQEEIKEGGRLHDLYP